MEPAERVGVVIAGRYRLERLLGVGGMGAVYEAMHIGVEKRFAVKLLHADSARAPDSVVRFTQEARAAARIGHPNLVEIFDLGEAEDGTLYMVMELLAGRSLAEALRDGPLPIATAVAVALDLLAALDAAHRAGFIHRDIKPANVFLADRPAGAPSVKVLDFGIAKLVQTDAPKLTQSGVVVGTPLYMAPEQVMAEPEIDGRADVWAAGAALFEMLTGRPVHLAPTATAAAVKVVTEAAPRAQALRPEVDGALDAVVAKALAVRRDERFAGAREMIEALEKCRISVAPTLVDSGVAPSVANVVRGVMSAQARRRRLGIVAAAAIGVAMLAGLARWRAESRESERTSAGDEEAAGAIGAVRSVPSTTGTGVDSIGAPSAATASAAPATEPIASVPFAANTSAGAPSTTASAPGRGGNGPGSGARPRCASGEHLTRGHCCTLGLEWQSDHCDRPLATGVPF